MSGVRIGIIGAAGRMGRALTDAAAARGWPAAQGIDADGDAGALAARVQVLIDFSAPAALEGTLDAACKAGIPTLIGTTGLATSHHALIDRAAERIAVLQTGNTSLGVNLLAALVEQAAARLGKGWDIEIAETHHRMKADAPSGTALLLGQAAAAGRRVALTDGTALDRNRVRTPGTIGFASLRGGTVAGDHAVHFLGEGERLTLSHSAENRSVFAAGALTAAAWLAGQPAGRYTMKDVLTL